MLECVVNISEGRRPDVIDGLARACGPALLDVHVDADHHRSVFTIAATDPAVTEAAARALAVAASESLSLDAHDGVHPRLGVIDVVPFVALGPTGTAVSVVAARDFARWIGSELDVPAFLYDLADPEHRSLPAVRRDAFSARAPDAGPPAPHPRLGATAVGARPAMIAVNLELADDDGALARTVAAALRERDGGLPGVRALGFVLPSLGHAQVSMNLVDLAATSLEAACTTARARVEALGGQVVGVELVGLVPAASIESAGAEFLAWSRLGPGQTIELRAAAATGDPDGSGGVADDATPAADPASPA